MRNRFTKPHRHNFTPWLIALAALALLVGTGYAVYRWNESRQDIPKVQTKKEAQDIKEDTARRVNNNAGNPDPAKAGGEPTENTPSVEIGIVVNRASQMEPGAAINVRTTITGTSSGTCEIQLTQSGQPAVTKQFPVVTASTYATCESADIPASDIPASGDWNLVASVKSGASSAKSETIKVKVTK